MGADFEDQVWSAILQPITPFRHKNSGIHLGVKIERAVMEIDCLMLACYLQGCLGGQSDVFMILQLSPSEFRFTVSSLPVAWAILREKEIASPHIHISFFVCSPADAARESPPSIAPRLRASPPSPLPLQTPTHFHAAPLTFDIGDRLQHAFRFISQTLTLDNSVGLAFQAALWQAKRSMVSPPCQASPKSHYTIIFFHNCRLPLDCYLVAALLQTRFGGRAKNFDVQQVSNSAYSFCVASTAAQVSITACSPLSTPFFFASIIVVNSAATTPNAPLRAASPRRPCAINQQPPAVVIAPPAFLSGTGTLPESTTTPLDTPKEVRPSRHGFNFFNRILSMYHTEITRHIYPPRHVPTISFWILCHSNSVNPNIMLITNALDHYFSVKPVFQVAKLSQFVFRSSVITKEARFEILKHSPLVFKCFSLYFFDQLSTATAHEQLLLQTRGPPTIEPNLAEKHSMPISILGPHPSTLCMQRSLTNKSNEQEHTQVNNGSIHACTLTSNTSPTATCHRPTSTTCTPSAALLLTNVQTEGQRLSHDLHTDKLDPSTPSLEPVTLDMHAHHRSQPPSALGSVEPAYALRLSALGPPPTNHATRVERPLSPACMRASLEPQESGQNRIPPRLASTTPHPCPAQLQHLLSPSDNSDPASPLTACMTPHIDGSLPPMSYRDALLSPLQHAPSPHSDTPINTACNAFHHTPHQRPLSPILSKRRCFRCLALDHQVQLCRDPIRCARCWCSGHKASRCRAVRLLPFFARLPPTPAANPAFSLQHTPLPTPAMANSTAPTPADLAAATNPWPRAGNGPSAPLLGIPVARIIPLSATTNTTAYPTPAPPPLSQPIDLEALRATLNEARAAAAFGLSPPNAGSARHGRRFGLPIELAPTIVAPPCLVNNVSHIAFAHLRSPVHNPATLIHDAILAHAGNPSFSVAGSWRGAGCVTFESASVRDYLVALGSIDFRGNHISFEPVELADRASPVFDQLIEVKASEFPHELWHDAGIRWALSHLGDVCSVDHYCVDGRDYTAVRALIMVDRRRRLPDSLPIQLPPSNDIKVVKIARLATVLDQMGPLDASPFSSDSDSDSNGRRGHHSRGPFNTHHATDDMPRGPPPSPAFDATTTTPMHVGASAGMPLHVSSGDDGPDDCAHPVVNISSDSDSAPPSQMASPPTAFSASTVIGSSTTPVTTCRPSPRPAAAVGGFSLTTPPPSPDGYNQDNLDDLPPPNTVQLPSAFSPYDSSNSPGLHIDVSTIAFSAGASSSGMAPEQPCRTPSPIYKPEHSLTMLTPATKTAESHLHESVLRKLRRSAKRSADKSMSLRRSSRLAAKEPRVFTDMTTKAVRAKAKRLTATDVAKALKDAIRDAQLDIPDAPPAPAAALADIARLCGADDAAADSIACADITDNGAADVLP